MAIKKRRAFTLIELLMVIAIIGVLSGIVLVRLDSMRTKGRDAKRVSEIRQLQNALELFYSVHSRYPYSGQCGATSPNSGWSNSVECLSGDKWVRDSSYDLSGLISDDPIDPINQLNWPRGAYYYYSRNYGGDGQWYMIVYSLEVPNPAIEASDGVTAPNGQYFHYGNNLNGIVTVGVIR